MAQASTGPCAIFLFGLRRIAAVNRCATQIQDSETNTRGVLTWVNFGRANGIRLPAGLGTGQQQAQGGDGGDAVYAGRGAAGFGVARPFVDNERYDVIVDAPRRLWRVQVKASGAVHYQGFG